MRLYTSVMAQAILAARQYASVRRLADQLGQALESRAVIDQARGMLMAIHGINAEQAFEQLTRESQDTNVKLREIAARIVETVGSGRRPQGNNSSLVRS